MKNEYNGCWPTMITPFTEDNRLDYKAIKGLVDWYVSKGAAGIFAVCQSSEMFFLSEQEKLDLARATVEAAEGRIKVIASGHTSDLLPEQIQQLWQMAQIGVDAVVLVSNRLAKINEGDEVLAQNAEKIFTALPDVHFGLYECPYPYLRLLSDKFLQKTASEGKLIFLKDVSCSSEIQKRRVELVKGTKLSLFNANTSTVLDSWLHGYKGYNGVMANFHIDLYDWMYKNYKKQPELARELSDFLTLAAVIEVRAYPISAKWYQNKFAVPMSIITRSKSFTLLDENGKHEIEALVRAQENWYRRLGL